MASPWKHPKTGIYWSRRAVPEALRPCVGKTIVQRSLKTKDPSEAKGRFLTVAAAIEREWTRLAKAAEMQTPPPDKLSPMQIQGLAGQFYRWLVAKHTNDPGRAQAWLAEIERDNRWIDPGPFRPSGAGTLYRPQVEAFLAERGTIPLAPDVGAVAPALEKYATGPLADLWRRPGLSLRDRAIVTVAALIARDQTGDMRAYFALALRTIRGA